MERKLSYIIAFLAVTLATGSAPAPAAEAGPGPQTAGSLQIHLPREVTVEDSLLTLGQISVVRGEAALAAKVRSIGMGRLSVPGQKALLDRPTILSRLASSGIPARNVRLTGADAVVVRRYQKTIGTDDFIEAGRAFLNQHPPGPGICELTPTIKPRDLVLPARVTDLQLTPRFVKSTGRGYVTVQIGVAVERQEIGTRDISFRLKYRNHRVLTVKEIAEGEALTPDNVRIEATVGDQPEPVGWQPPYGQVAARKLPADTELRRDMLGAAPAPVLVRRNDTVVIRIERPGLLVTAVGLALQEARAGEYVKVRNADSSRIIVCKVNADGTVEPVL
jgi:flagella basal body P-ring formation protein FlgA